MQNSTRLIIHISDGVDIRQSATTHETLNAHTVDVLAAKTTGILFGKANGVAVRFSLSPIFT
jgi:hypothetical protein